MKKKSRLGAVRDAWHGLMRAVRVVDVKNRAVPLIRGVGVEYLFVDPLCDMAQNRVHPLDVLRDNGRVLLSLPFGAQTLRDIRSVFKRGVIHADGDERLAERAVKCVFVSHVFLPPVGRRLAEGSGGRLSAEDDSVARANRDGQAAARERASQDGAVANG